MLDSFFITTLKKSYNLLNPIILKNLGGFNTCNLEILEGDKNLVLKCITDNDAVKIKRIVQIWNFLDHHMIPVPKIVPSTNGDNFTLIENQFCILNEKKTGKCLHQTDFNNFSLKNVAWILYKFHHLAKSCSDEILSLFKSLPKQKKLFESFDLLQILNTIKEDKIKNIFSENIKSRKNLIKKLALGRIEDFALRKNELVHGDFHNENILYTDDNQISSLLDFENVMIGDGFVDIMHFILLGCCNTGFEENNLHLAKIFAKSYLSLNPRCDENIIQNMKLYLKNCTDSYFFEQLFIKTKNPFYLKFIERDTKKFYYFSSKFYDFYKKVFKDNSFSQLNIKI